MLNNTAINKSITLNSNEEIKKICQPLFDALKINYVTFHRIYSDATTVRLTTYLEWTLHYINQDYFKNLTCDHYPAIECDYAQCQWEDLSERVLD